MAEELNQGDNSPNHTPTARDLLRRGIIGSLLLAGVVEIIQPGSPVAKDIGAVALGGFTIDRLVIPGAKLGMSFLERTVDGVVAWRERRNND